MTLRAYIRTGQTQTEDRKRTETCNQARITQEKRQRKNVILRLEKHILIGSGLTTFHGIVSAVGKIVKTDCQLFASIHHIIHTHTKTHTYVYIHSLYGHTHTHTHTHIYMPSIKHAFMHMRTCRINVYQCFLENFTK